MANIQSHFKNGGFSKWKEGEGWKGGGGELMIEWSSSLHVNIIS